MAGTYRTHGSNTPYLVAGGFIARANKKHQEQEKQENRAYHEQIHNLYRKQSLVDYGIKLREATKAKKEVNRANKSEDRKTKMSVIKANNIEQRKNIHTKGSINRSLKREDRITKLSSIRTKEYEKRKTLTHKASLIKKLRKK